MSLPLWSKVAEARTMCCALSAERAILLCKCSEDFEDEARSNRLFTSVLIHGDMKRTYQKNHNDNSIKQTSHQASSTSSIPHIQHPPTSNTIHISILQVNIPPNQASPHLASSKSTSCKSGILPPNQASSKSGIPHIQHPPTTSTSPIIVALKSLFS